MNFTKKGIKLTAIILVVTIINFVLPINSYVVQASTSSTSEEVEEMLKDIISEYGESNIIFEDGVVLNPYEEVSLESLSDGQSINWQSRDSGILEIVEGKIIKGISSGTTFLIGEDNGKYHVRQVYVSNSDMRARSAISSYSGTSERKGNYVVYLDPGHGGSDPGSLESINKIPVLNGAKEKDLNLSIALKVRDRLQSMGIIVKMSRDTDKFVKLEDIVTGANAANPDVFVSIHQNSFDKSSAYGIETYWNKGAADKALATSLQNRLIENTGAYDRGVKNEPFIVIKSNNMPSSLVECGFISNPDEAKLLKTDSYQNKIADAIANGTYDYLKANVTLDPLVANRVYGLNRYETSYEVFKRGWNNSGTAILASGVDYPDALCATPLASKYGAPILLAENTSLRNQGNLTNMLKSYGVKNVFIVGGTGVLPSSFEGELASMGISSKRLGGLNRYETSVKIAQEVGSQSKEVAVVSGLDFADGLSISSIAGRKNMPILLSEVNTLPQEVANYISGAGINKAYVIGSTGALSNNVSNKLPNVERLGGKNRYETNKVIFNRFRGELDLSNFYIASGLDFPDALASSALASKQSSFVLLSNSNYVEPEVKDVMANSRGVIQNLYVLGGKTIVSDNVLYNLGVNVIR